MPQFIKNFIDWMKFKIKLDVSSHTPPFFKEGEIWWCSVGENVGREISGKGKTFTRPVLIIRKLDRFSFISLPLTSQSKEGSWYKSLNIKGVENFIILPQVHYFDYKRMDKLLCTIPDKEFREIRKAFIDLLLGL